ncbi:MAG: hypothetical protein ABSF29_12530 [Tepidisphaeraceae bacterium]|jgi:hypothetical protein
MDSTLPPKHSLVGKLSIAAAVASAALVTVGKQPILSLSRQFNIDRHATITWTAQIGLLLAFAAMGLAAFALLRKKGEPTLPYIGLFVGMAALILSGLAF